MNIIQPTLKATDKNQKNGLYELRIGRLMLYKGKTLDDDYMQFEDGYGKLNDINRVRILTSKWNDLDGKIDMPKPFIYDIDKKLIETGDDILYSYLNGTNEQIVIMGSLGSMQGGHSNILLSSEYKDAYDAKIELLSNKKRFYHYTVTEEGDIYLDLEGYEEGLGNIVINVRGGDKGGLVKVQTDGRIEFNQLDKDNIPQAQFVFDNSTAGEENIVLVDRNQNNIEMNKDGLIIEGKKIRASNIDQSISLEMILTAIIDQILLLQFTTNTGTTMPNPLNSAQIKKIQTDLIDNLFVK